MIKDERESKREGKGGIYTKDKRLGQRALLWKGRLRAGKERNFGPYPKRCRARARKKERERGVSGEPSHSSHYAP